MGVLVGGILIIAGIFTIVIGGGIGLLTGSLLNSVPGAEAASGFTNIGAIITLVIGGGLVVIGLIIMLTSRARGRQKRELAMHVYQNGIDTEGIVTFVDRNYSMLVNNNPIYSIVEYKFRDQAGREFVKRVNDANSEVVIRNALQVGSRIAVKYLPDDPTQNIMMLPTEGIATA
ncbi:MAG: hypothetical protein JW910_18855 [Anaerolineae bacterium]|nr:hypothetical protein [Anaerolineae bacterium]